MNFNARMQAEEGSQENCVCWRRTFDTMWEGTKGVWLAALPGRVAH
jgi:hypothetical protein